MLDNCNIDRLLSYYFFHYRKAKRANKVCEPQNDNHNSHNNENIVVRDGKKYRKVKANETAWADKIF